MNLAKPSIFSRDYERRMRKRRRTIMSIVCILIVVLFALLFKFKIQKMDFNNIKSRIQAWVDTGKSEDKVENSEVVLEDESEEVMPEVQVPNEFTMDLMISDGITVKALYTDENGVKKFVSIDPIDGVTYDISPSGQQILITDPNQNIKIFTTDGNIKDVTKKTYISGAGTTFYKDQILLDNPQYIWSSQVRFIDDTRIVYVSQLPYFGSVATNKYVWLVDLKDAPQQIFENVIWNLKAPEITIGELVAEKGITILENGKTFYLNADGIVSE